MEFVVKNDKVPLWDIVFQLWVMLLQIHQHIACTVIFSTVFTFCIFDVSLNAFVLLPFYSSFFNCRYCLDSMKMNKSSLELIVYFHLQIKLGRCNWILTKYHRTVIVGQSNNDLVKKGKTIHRWLKFYLYRNIFSRYCVLDRLIFTR